MIVTQLGYTDSYNKPESQAISVIKRPLTEDEAAYGIKMLKKFQRMLRAIAVMALIFGLIMIFVDTDTVIGLVLMLITIIFGSLSLGMAPFIYRVRKQIEEALREGTVIEVRGTASRSRAMWTVGPISLFATSEINNIFREGMQVSVLFIPRTKTAFSVNNIRLRKITRIKFPPNIEAMAVVEPSVQPEEQPSPPPDPTFEPYTPEPHSQADVTERMSQLTELKEKGLITEEEFQVKKEELLRDL
jgi:hypothetical protein